VHRQLLWHRGVGRRSFPVRDQRLAPGLAGGSHRLRAGRSKRGTRLPRAGSRRDRLRHQHIAEEKVRYELKKPWRDGTRFVLFEPHDLIARLCAMVPPPWFHMIRFHGVLAPNAKLRKQVVASARPSASAALPKSPEAPFGVKQLSLFDHL